MVTDGVFGNEQDLRTRVCQTRELRYFPAILRPDSACQINSYARYWK
jgi:hypothetical protein